MRGRRHVDSGLINFKENLFQKALDTWHPRGHPVDDVLLNQNSINTIKSRIQIITLHFEMKCK